MSAGTIFFSLCALVSLVGALATVLARSPIRSAVGLLTSILGIAGLFLKLHAEFLAAIQLIVYAGAVVVLFVFVVMLLGPDASASGSGPGKARLSRGLAVAFMLGIAGFALVMLGARPDVPTPFRVMRPDHGSVEAVGHQLFTQTIVPFELATALLIVAVVGAIAVARSKPHVKKQRSDASRTKRLFVGPLHPRDAGHPIAKEPAE